MIAVVHLVVGLGMLVIVPLGLGLVSASGLDLVRRFWLVAAIPGAVSVWLPRGPVAVVLACVYFAGCLALVVVALRVLSWPLRASDVALLTALVTPSVAGLALVAERAGYELFGYSLTVLALTVAHFHFAGFAAALVSGLVAIGVPGRAGSLAALSVPVGTAIVLAGFFLGDGVELAGAVVLTIGMWSVGWALLTGVPASSRLTKALLTIGAGVLVVTMLLAVGWALGHVAGTPYLPLEWMVATHGLANATGFALCTLIALRRQPAHPLVASYRV